MAEVVAQVEQVVARAERAVVPAAQVRAEPARVAGPVVQVLRAVQARPVLERARLVVRAPALERPVPLAQPAERVVPVPVAQPRAELVPARVRPVLVQREPAAVPAPGELVQERVPAAEAGERAALTSSMRSWAARRRYMSPLRRMSLSRCGLSAASATTMANRAASSSKPL